MPPATKDKMALIRAAKEGNNAMIAALLDQYGAEIIEAKDTINNTALIWAAYNGHRDTVELLLELGAAINAANVVGDTALIHAALGGHIDMVEFLLRKGTTPSLAGNHKADYNRSQIFIRNPDIGDEIVMLIEHWTENQDTQRHLTQEKSAAAKAEQASKERLEKLKQLRPKKPF